MAKLVGVSVAAVLKVELGAPVFVAAYDRDSGSKACLNEVPTRNIGVVVGALLPAQHRSLSLNISTLDSLKTAGMVFHG